MKIFRERDKREEGYRKRDLRGDNLEKGREEEEGGARQEREESGGRRLDACFPSLVPESDGLINVQQPTRSRYPP